MRCSELHWELEERVPRLRGLGGTYSVWGVVVNSRHEPNKWKEVLVREGGVSSWEEWVPLKVLRVLPRSGYQYPLRC